MGSDFGFGSALAHLHEGRPVRRRAWPYGVRLHLIEDDPMGRPAIVAITHTVSAYAGSEAPETSVVQRVSELLAEDICATDWELYVAPPRGAPDA